MGRAISLEGVVVSGVEVGEQDGGRFCSVKKRGHGRMPSLQHESGRAIRGGYSEAGRAAAAFEIEFCLATDHTTTPWSRDLVGVSSTYEIDSHLVE